MSHVLLSSGQDNDHGALENPYAVWLRNVPTWLDEDRFYDEISSWYDVDKEKSYCFKNKQDSSWIGVRYGWAIVTFKSKKSRNKFLDNDERHFVQENERAPYEKLKVSPWYEKPNKKQNLKEKPIYKVPLYKSDLEKETQDHLSYEDFSRNTSDTSIQSFRGRIKQFIKGPSGLGCVGDIEIRLVGARAGAGGPQTELVIFHTDTVWLEAGARLSDTQESRLKQGIEVSFTARKIPQGLVESRRFQAKAVWLGEEAYPKYIIPPPASKLDEYLEDYVRESGQRGSKSSSPESDNLRKPNIDSSVAGSPAPSSIPARQKPLKGGLNQLNSSQDKTKIAPTLKKPTPTNFAQAVSAVPTLIKEEHSNLILAVGTVESITSEVEAIINIPDHGNFSLHLSQIDLGYKPTHGINKYITAKQSTVSVTLKQGKSLPGSKPKYEIVRAHLIEDKKALEDRFDPFLNDFKNKNRVTGCPVSTASVWEELNVGEKSKNGHDYNNGCDLEIDLDELDEYYDDLQRITEYLEKELPKVIPTIANDKNCVQKLANKILSNPKNDEASELQTFLDHQQISSRIKHIFIGEYVKFRSKDEYGDSSLSPEESPRTPDRIEDNSEIDCNLKLFFTWLKNKEKKPETLAMKFDLYTFVIKKFPNTANEWQRALKETRISHFVSFIKKSCIGDIEYVTLKEELGKYLPKYNLDLPTLITWLETDTNTYRSIYNEPFDTDPNTDYGNMGLNLTKFEKEYQDHQLSKGSQNSIAIIRAIQFLRYSEIKFEGLHKLHLRCSDDQQRSRNREFSQKIQNLLFKWPGANQRVLDDVNRFLSKETRGAVERDASMQLARRFDKYMPLLSQSLCDFFGDKYEVRKNRFEEREKIKKVAIATAFKETPEQKTSGVTKSKRTNDDENTISAGFRDEDYVGFSNFLELAMASGQVRIAAPASVEAVIWTFRASDVSFRKLEDIYSQSQAMGGVAWVFQISQLKLNPPLGVTVPQIAEFLNAYFGSVNNISLSTGEDTSEEVTVNTTEENEAEEEEVTSTSEEIEVVAEEDLLSMIQMNLFEQYKDPEVGRLVIDLKRSGLRSREEELIRSYEELFSSHQLFAKTCWPHNEDQFDFAPQCALLTAGIWHDLSVSSEFLKMCVRNIHDNDLSYHGVLIKWAKILETSGLFSSSVLDIFTIIKATLLVYDENVPNTEFLNISTNYCLYNVEGFVVEHLSESIFSVQTRFSLVLCHLGVTYCQRPEDQTFPLPSDHWKQSEMESSLCIGSKVYLHSTGIKDPKGKIICQIADIVWAESQGNRDTDPPETGILLPGTGGYKKYVQYFAEKIVSRNPESGFSDTSYTNNNARYQELESLHTPELFLMSDTWAAASVPGMRKEFVFCELGGMTRPLLRTNWAANLNTSDQEKERLLNETFSFFSRDPETLEMLEVISPYVERAGLRNAMKILHQKYPETPDREETRNDNDTDSEKRKSMSGSGDNTTADETLASLSSKETGAVGRPGILGGRNRQLSTDTIKVTFREKYSIVKLSYKDETLWMAENNLEQLWAEEAEQEKAARMEDLAEVNDDSEEYIEDEENRDKDSRHLGAIGSSKPKSDEEEIIEGEKTPVVSETEPRARDNTEDRMDKLEAAVCNMATWQPVASDIISGNRDLIMQLSSRIEYLETTLDQMRLSQGRENGELKVSEDKESVKKSGRTYVRIMREGEEEDMAEVPTNSQGLLPQATVTALFPATTAIKFRVQSSSGGKTWRALLLEDDLYHPPGDTGWGDRVYTCTQPKKTSSDIPRSEAGSSSLVDPGPGPFSMGSLTPASSSLAGNIVSSSLVSPFMPSLGGIPPLPAHIWGTGGLGGGLGACHALGPLGQNIGSNPGPGAGAANYKGFGGNK